MKIIQQQITKAGRILKTTTLFNLDLKLENIASLCL